MNKYTFQLRISDNQDTDSYLYGAFPNLYTEVVECKDKYDAYSKIMDWTYTVTDRDSEYFDEFEMFINGETLTEFIN